MFYTHYTSRLLSPFIKWVIWLSPLLTDWKYKLKRNMISLLGSALSPVYWFHLVWKERIKVKHKKVFRCLDRAGLPTSTSNSPLKYIFDLRILPTPTRFKGDLQRLNCIQEEQSSSIRTPLQPSYALRASFFPVIFSFPHHPDKKWTHFTPSCLPSW